MLDTYLPFMDRYCLQPAVSREKRIFSESQLVTQALADWHHGGERKDLAVLLAIFFIALVVIIVKSVVIVHQSNRAVIERFGKYQRTLEPGISTITPFFDQVVHRFDLRETLHDFKPTSVITKDNVTVRINAITYYHITDVKAAAYNVQNFENAMEQLIITTLRNLIGEMELDEVLNGRNAVNARLQGVLDEATHRWGLKVSRVELKEVTAMGDVADAMDKQMVAERTRRAQILEAEGSKRSAILHAEGAKESAILKAEGEREVVLIRAKAEAEALTIAARAQQEAIKTIISAFGHQADEKFLQLKMLEALPKVAEGKASTVFIPTQFGQLASLASVAGEALRASQPQGTALPSANPSPGTHSQRM
jgi:regulator of protease activity HflC (stomatin/prohibitin superfamily)